MKISGFVCSYNREALIETCLRSLRFVDELIVIDKSSTDQTREIASSIADQVIQVPWSPTVEETRAFALSMCRHDRIVYLDDDECLSAEAISYLNTNLREDTAEVYVLPCRQHVLGRHEENAYYWPQNHVRAFVRGAVEFTSTVHGGLLIGDERKYAYADAATGISFHNISHPDASTWIEKTNRYTSVRDRSGSVDQFSCDMFASARAALERWISQSGENPSEYVQAVGLLRAVYDMVDLVKHWEQRRAENGNTLFELTCRNLQLTYDRLEEETGIRTK